MLEQKNMTDSHTKKRPREDSTDVTEVRPVKKARSIRFGSITVPLNDAKSYWRALQSRKVIPVPPSAREVMEDAVKDNLASKIVYGTDGNYVIEGLIQQEEAAFPWLVSKVTIKYQEIEYNPTTWERSPRSREIADQLVSPKTIPWPRLPTIAECEHMTEGIDPARYDSDMPANDRGGGGGGIGQLGLPNKRS